MQLTLLAHSSATRTETRYSMLLNWSEHELSLTKYDDHNYLCTLDGNHVDTSAKN
jgi:hypothetical protein